MEDANAQVVDKRCLELLNADQGGTSLQHLLFGTDAGDERAAAAERFHIKRAHRGTGAGQVGVRQRHDLRPLDGTAANMSALVHSFLPTPRVDCSAKSNRTNNIGRSDTSTLYLEQEHWASLISQNI